MRVLLLLQELVLPLHTERSHGLHGLSAQILSQRRLATIGGTGRTHATLAAARTPPSRAGA